MGYYQIKMDEKAIKYTSFVLGDHQYDFCRMSFGLSNAPRTFQRAMRALFKDQVFIKGYLDNILIHSRTQEDRLEHINIFYNIVKENKLSVNYEKSYFWKAEVTYLGNIINADGIRADISRVNTSTTSDPEIGGKF